MLLLEGTDPGAGLTCVNRDGAAGPRPCSSERNVSMRYHPGSRSALVRPTPRRATPAPGMHGVVVTFDEYERTRASGNGGRTEARRDSRSRRAKVFPQPASAVPAAIPENRRWRSQRHKEIGCFPMRPLACRCPECCLRCPADSHDPSTARPSPSSRVRTAIQYC